MTATTLRADARAIPLPDASVDLIVTSPPYFALRSYTDGGEHYAGQIGAESTPAEYIASLIDCTREWVRVLKPSGSLFVNLGDKYSGAGRGNHDSDRLNNTPEFRASRLRTLDRRQHVGKGIIPAKSLMMLPERYRIAAVDELGLIARAVLVWSKPNGLPESVTDRVRRSHEDWVHLTKLPRYFSAVDEIREPSTPQRGLAGTFKRPQPSHTLVPGQAATQHRADRADAPAYNPLGKLPGSVWEIATEPLKVPAELGIDHFAAFPTEWPRRIILGWSPSGICTACGEGRRPVAGKAPWWEAYKREHGIGDYLAGNGLDAAKAGKQRATRNDIPEGPKTVITGEACACPDTTAPTRPSVVLDPFGGTGTTALVASVLGRHGISVDMSADYCRLARWRTTDPAQRAKAARLTAPPKQLDGQGDLFEIAGAA